MLWATYFTKEVLLTHLLANKLKKKKEKALPRPRAAKKEKKRKSIKVSVRTSRKSRKIWQYCILKTTQNQLSPN
jgi:hypothetical protein